MSELALILFFVVVFLFFLFFFFFQAEDGIRDADVTGVQTCALPIYAALLGSRAQQNNDGFNVEALHHFMQQNLERRLTLSDLSSAAGETSPWQFKIGRASCRERV